MKKKREFNNSEKKILRHLYQTKAPLTIYEISRDTNISQPTVKKYVKVLLKEKLIAERQTIFGSIGKYHSTKSKYKEYVFNFKMLKK